MIYLCEAVAQGVRSFGSTLCTRTNAKAYKLMEVATRICFNERSVKFEEDQLHDTPPATQEGKTISPPIF